MTLDSNKIVIVGLDLGRNTGVVTLHPDGKATGHTWTLRHDKSFVDRDGNGFQDFSKALFNYIFSIDLEYPDHHIIIGYEDVQFIRSRAQTNIWSGLRAVVYVECTDHTDYIHSVPTGTLKKYATGKGNASKEQMMKTIPDGIFDDIVITDDIADAYWVAQHTRRAFLDKENQ